MKFEELPKLPLCFRKFVNGQTRCYRCKRPFTEADLGYIMVERCRERKEPHVHAVVALKCGGCGQDFGQDATADFIDIHRGITAFYQRVVFANQHGVPPGVDPEFPTDPESRGRSRTWGRGALFRRLEGHTVIPTDEEIRRFSNLLGRTSFRRDSKSFQEFLRRIRDDKDGKGGRRGKK